MNAHLELFFLYSENVLFSWHPNIASSPKMGCLGTIMNDSYRHVSISRRCFKP